MWEDKNRRGVVEGRGGVVGPPAPRCSASDQASSLAENSGSVGESPNSHVSSRLVRVANFIKGAQEKGGEAMGEWVNWGWKRMGNFSQTVPCFSNFFFCFLSISHIFYTFPKVYVW